MFNTTVSRSAPRCDVPSKIRERLLSFTGDIMTEKHGMLQCRRENNPGLNRRNSWHAILKKLHGTTEAFG